MDESLTDRAPDATERDARPRSSRFALTAAIGLLLVIVAWLLFLRTHNERVPSDSTSGENTEEMPERATPVIDVDSFPTGALAGEPAPEIILDLFDGDEFVLSQHLADDGRPVVLNLWASWCTPCRKEIPEFSRVAEDNPGVAFVGAAVEDARGPAEAFASEVNATYPLGIDRELTVKNGYPFIGLPVTYLIGGDGGVVRQIQGQMNAATLQAFLDHDFGT